VIRPKYYSNTSVSQTGATTLGAWKNEGPNSTVSSAAGLSVGGSLGELATMLGGKIEKAFTLGLTFHQKYQAYGVNVGRPITKSGWDFVATAAQANAGSMTSSVFIKAVQMDLIKV